MNCPSKERVTIVVPVYNRPELIVRCLDSLRMQTYRPMNVIVVDNASTDETASVVSDWKTRNEDNEFSVELLSESKRGAAYARQKGLENTSTDKVMFLDSDDSMCPECVATVMDAWQSNPTAEAVAWPITRTFDGKKHLSHSIKGNLLERHLVHAIFLTVGYAVRVDYLRKVGGWRGEFPVWDDFEVGTRVLLHSPEVIAIDKPLVDVYPQQESITGVDFSGKAGLWEKSLDGIETTIRSSDRQDINRLQNIVSYRRAILAADYAKEKRLDLAKPLYHQALREVPAKKRPLIRFAYHWTRLRMRGAFSIVGYLL